MNQSKYISEASIDWVENTSFDRVFAKVLVDQNTSDAFAFIVHSIEPGGRVPKHSHAEESLYYFIEGSGTIYLGQETFRGTPGSAVYIASFEVHGIDNTGEVPIKYVEVKIPVKHQHDGGDLR